MTSMPEGGWWTATPETASQTGLRISFAPTHPSGRLGLANRVRISMISGLAFRMLTTLRTSRSSISRQTLSPSSTCTPVPQQGGHFISVPLLIAHLCFRACLVENILMRTVPANVRRLVHRFGGHGEDARSPADRDGATQVSAVGRWRSTVTDIIERTELFGLESRAVRPADAEALAGMMSLPGYCWGTAQIPFQSLEQVRSRMEKLPPVDRHLVALIDGEPVGSASLARSTGRRSHVAGSGMGVHDALTTSCASVSKERRHR